MIHEFLFSENQILYVTDSANELSRLNKEEKKAIPLYTLDNYETDPEGIPWPHSEYAVSDLINVPKEDLYKIYCRLSGISLDILETARLKVREMTVMDVDDFYRIYSGEGITEFMEPLIDDPEDERLYTRNYIEDIYKFYDYGLWTVIDKESNRIIGRAGISNRDGFETVDLGFVIEKEYQNRGLAFEVCSAILKYAKEELGFTKIQALVKPKNIISIHLLNKLGFINSKEEFDGYMIMYHYA